MFGEEQKEVVDRQQPVTLSFRSKEAAVAGKKSLPGERFEYWYPDHPEWGGHFVKSFAPESTVNKKKAITLAREAFKNPRFYLFCDLDPFSAEFLDYLADVQRLTREAGALEIRGELPGFTLPTEDNNEMYLVLPLEINGKELVLPLPSFWVNNNEKSFNRYFPYLSQKDRDSLPSVLKSYKNEASRRLPSKEILIEKIKGILESLIPDNPALAGVIFFGSRVFPERKMYSRFFSDDPNREGVWHGPSPGSDLDLEVILDLPYKKIGRNGAEFEKGNLVKNLLGLFTQEVQNRISIPHAISHDDKADLVLTVSMLKEMVQAEDTGTFDHEYLMHKMGKKLAAGTLPIAVVFWSNPEVKKLIEKLGNKWDVKNVMSGKSEVEFIRIGTNS